jgi:Tfp pilus assembly protein FimV
VQPGLRRPAKAKARLAPVPAARPESGIRLTRRGRIVVRAAASTLAVVAVLAGVLILDRPAQAGSQAHPVPVAYHVVLPGETLWQIAGEAAPKVDRRDTVARILELNALSTAAVSPGQRIAVPVVPTS